ncbi:MAG: hypothetical protein VYE15_02220 [Myxococcota bacterium]|nr:hypothetical protein [Myxococcota bacterium]
MRPVRLRWLVLISLLIGLPGCKKPPPEPNGATCQTNGDCQSELCYGQICLDPLADDDGDGLVNKVELLLTGTRPDDPDTDGDGLGDLLEVGNNPSEPADSDEDDANNAVESAVKDSDCDGAPDQNDNPNWDNEPDAVGVPDPEQPGSCLADSDQDGVPDTDDNCRDIPNPTQENSDEDGFGDSCDLCPEGPDDLDLDEDGIPDTCDLCPGAPDGVDLDGDGVPSGCDTCPGGDDNGPDEDGDGVPEDCDICPGGDDDGLDGDKDGVPIACDTCPGFDDLADADEDGVADGCDLCPGGPPECGGKCSTNSDCDDANPCSVDTCDLETQVCAHVVAEGCECLFATDCDDADPCTHDSCDLDSTCQHENLAGCCTADAHCEDPHSCTTDTCDVTINQCVHTPDDALCDDEDDCTEHSCDLVLGCVDITPFISISGPADSHQGFLLWNVAGEEGQEPDATGHDDLCGEPSHYYLASRDHDDVDPESPGGFHLALSDKSSFPGLEEAMETLGYASDKLHWKVGLMSQGADVEGEDWWVETTDGVQVETRTYYPVSQSKITLTLDGTPMLIGTLEYLRSHTTHPQDCLGAGEVSAYTNPTGLLNTASTDSDAWIIGEALIGDLQEDGLQIHITSLPPVGDKAYDEGGRSGVFFEVETGTVKKVPLYCQPD